LFIVFKWIAIWKFFSFFLSFFSIPPYFRVAIYFLFQLYLRLIVNQKIMVAVFIP
jgi:hypothetical protein